MAETIDLQSLIAWAREEGQQLAARTGADVTQATGAAGVDFLRVHGGPQSDFYKLAAKSAESYRPDAVGEALLQWADAADAGLVSAAPPEVSARRQAATDLMEQVNLLLEDGGIHSAAPILLAGAALEEFLRSLAFEHGTSTSSRPSLETYSAALRKDGVLSTQDGKDVTFMAGMRNAAAHGKFDELSREQARLMAAHVNLFIGKHTE